MRISDWSSDVCSSDLVHSAYVVGVPDKERGNLLVAAVVPREGASLDFDMIEGEMRRRLSRYKVPRAYVELAREDEIGRASCRERVGQYVSISVVAVSLKKK